MADGTVIGWGLNGGDQLSIPAAATNVVAIAAERYYSLALKADRTVVGWGSNGSGETDVPASATNVVAVAYLVECAHHVAGGAQSAGKSLGPGCLPLG